MLGLMHEKRAPYAELALFIKHFLSYLGPRPVSKNVRRISKNLTYGKKYFFVLLRTTFYFPHFEKTAHNNFAWALTTCENAFFDIFNLINVLNLEVY